MEIKERLTNEEILKTYEHKFEDPNQFDLVNYSIRLAEQMIRSGRSPRVKIHTENAALIVLEEILKGMDSYDKPEEKKQPVVQAMTSLKKEPETEQAPQVESNQETVLSE